MQSKRGIFQKIWHELWSIFLKGLIAILPLTITITLFTFSFRLIKSWLAPVHRLLEKTFLTHIPQSDLILIIIFILMIGLILEFFVLSSIIRGLEILIGKIPLVRPVYTGIKHLVAAFSQKDESVAFKQVVLVEFPRKGLFSLGFLTGELPAELAPDSNERYFNIFIPHTPNPTTGFFIILAESSIKPIEITRQEAIALIISSGLVLPERFVKKEKA